MPGIIGLLLMVIGWILILVSAFGSGFELNLGKLDGLSTGIVLVLLALCIGVAVPQIDVWRRRDRA